MYSLCFGTTTFHGIGGRDRHVVWSKLTNMHVNYWCEFTKERFRYRLSKIILCASQSESYEYWIRESEIRGNGSGDVINGTFLKTIIQFNEKLIDLKKNI